ncbi:putative Mannose-6-phosphate isomerase (manC) [Oenococcus oeni]|uniref:cupin domain-containing protein n=1 Tax=Oenococcus oeni TaxID=1247 RepID=UPI00107CE4E5|nr:cupin domain-containing protein [Oenococcus oeni]AVI93370.1 mannose-6-phosphate isomerase [Oenococcus oeni]SYV98486.1 putative Mannose-6-phosphate isomerase (manC) [Oenococcus oeni]SYW04019.1 putative Mannose-6-phosphate isomerase (manC) [Oenococcus oeni]SYW04146.1 putative Mannose-6-phosphate isomerase (manC) [Oenococcus oeni]SYW18947.1 putative Mannose-6-phosphate isomerase (manC) [Oenococcus oeni]
MEKVNLEDKFKQFNDYWSPKIVGDLGKYQIKLAKFHDQFVWHHHNNEDEFFLIIKGSVTIHLKENDQEKQYELKEGEFFIVPKGVEHMPVANGVAEVLLFEPATTLNTGNVKDEKTVSNLKRI